MIVEHKKALYDEESKLLNMKLKYQLMKGKHIEKTEIMDFPIRLYELGEFENILESNGFHKIVLHEVKNGYGEGSSFHVLECSK